MFFFFFHYTANTEIYTYLHTLSLHDALPICLQIVASFRNKLVQIIGLERTTILPIPTRKNQRGGKPPSRMDEEQRRSRKIRHCPGQCRKIRKSTRLNSSH